MNFDTKTVEKNADPLNRACVAPFLAAVVPQKKAFDSNGDPLEWLVGH